MVAMPRTIINNARNSERNVDSISILSICYNFSLVTRPYQTQNYHKQVLVIYCIDA